jgi:hypothetical protein
MQGTLHGTLDDFPLPDIIQLVSLSKKTGAVEIHSSEGSVGYLYFVQGRVVSARLDDLPPVEALLTFFTFPAGHFQFIDNEPPPPGEPITKSNELLLIEGIGRAEEWQRLRERIPSLDSILGLVADPAASSRDINLKPEEWRVLTLINGRDTLRAIARRTGFGDFRTARIIYHLIQAGLVAVHGRAAPEPPPPPPPEPLPGPPSGAELYRRLDQAASSALGATGRRVLEDAYRRLRVAPGADLDPVSAGNLCDQFERAASLLVGPGRARSLADTLRRTAADLYGG